MGKFLLFIIALIELGYIFALLLLLELQIICIPSSLVGKVIVTRDRLLVIIYTPIERRVCSLCDIDLLMVGLLLMMAEQIVLLVVRKLV